MERIELVMFGCMRAWCFVGTAPSLCQVSLDGAHSHIVLGSEVHSCPIFGYNMLLPSALSTPSAVDIVDEEEEFGTVNFTIPAPCTATSFSHTPHTLSPGATDLTEPLVPCPNSDRSTAEVLTLVLPVALFSIVACAVMVGIGVLSCYIIVSRKMHQGQ